MDTKYVILKADDFKYDAKSTVGNSWRRFLDFVIENDINASLGIIGNSIYKANQKFLHTTNDLAKSGHFEFFNHGYNHFLGRWFFKNIAEFKNTPLWYQKEHILKTQELAKSELGITLKTFGAPGNAIDSNTKLALELVDEIDNWLFGDECSSKLVLNRYNDAEFPCSNPDFEAFKSNINYKNEYMVLQLHPNAWDVTRFNEFKKIVGILKEQSDLYAFITPNEYSLIRNRDISVDEDT